MTEWVLDEKALLEAHERALNETRARIRAAVDSMLDEVGIADPALREAFHAKALMQAMPLARSVYAEDVERIRRTDGASSTRH